MASKNLCSCVTQSTGCSGIITIIPPPPPPAGFKLPHSYILQEFQPFSLVLLSCFKNMLTIVHAAILCVPHPRVCPSLSPLNTAQEHTRLPHHCLLRWPGAGWASPSKDIKPPKNIPVISFPCSPTPFCDFLHSTQRISLPHFLWAGQGHLLPPTPTRFLDLGQSFPSPPLSTHLRILFLALPVAFC